MKGIPQGLTPRLLVMVGLDLQELALVTPESHARSLCLAQGFCVGNFQATGILSQSSQANSCNCDAIAGRKKGGEG